MFRLMLQTQTAPMQATHLLLREEVVLITMLLLVLNLILTVLARPVRQTQIAILLTKTHCTN